jgi:hypothetical protein
MNPEQAWQAVLSQLQTEMPRASFDSWVRNTHCLSFVDGIVTIGVQNTYACEWLENRLSSTVSRLLTGMLNQQVEMRFVVDETEIPDEQEPDNTQEKERPTKNEPLEVEGVWESAYEQIVCPEKVIALNAYFIRHLGELGPELGWMYIGFRQAAYSAGGRSGERKARFTGKAIAALSGSTERTFWNRIARPETWEKLKGLVSLVDEKPLWDEKSPTPKRLPRKYTVAMTLPLTGADTSALTRWIAEHSEQYQGASGVLTAACETPVDELLARSSKNGKGSQPLTVHRLVRDLFSSKLPEKELEALAERLHLHIMPPGDLLVLPLFFVEHILPHLGTGPGWLLTILRDRCWVDPKSGRARSQVTVQGGYAEMAGWLGLSRAKTVWEWLRDPILKIYLHYNQSGQAEINQWDAARSFDVLLDEVPAEIIQACLRHQIRPEASGANFSIGVAHFTSSNGVGSNTGVAPCASSSGANFSIGVADFSGSSGADFSIGVARFSVSDGALFSIAMARISHFSGAICRVFNLLNSLKPALNIKTSTHPAKSDISVAQKGVGVDVNSVWKLDSLLENNGVRTSSQSELKKRDASAQAFVSWLIYGATPAAARLTDPVGNAIARLLDSPKTGAGGACNILAALPPQDFKSALEKDLNGGLVSTSGYSLALRQASTDVKKELLQRLFGMQERDGT